MSVATTWHPYVSPGQRPQYYPHLSRRHGARAVTVPRGRAPWWPKSVVLLMFVAISQGSTGTSPVVASGREMWVMLRPTAWVSEE
jgi:hypothetical protein